MRAVCFDGKKAVYRTDVPMPVRKKGQSLIRVITANICSTDKEILKGYRPDFRGVMGHEFVGEVMESDREDLIGKTVVGEMNEGCGTCLYCRTGREKHCPWQKTLGITTDGCFADYMIMADYLVHPIPEGMKISDAVYAEPLAAAVEILNQVDLNPTLNAAIIGDGRLSFMCAQVLALTGMDLTVIGKHPEKLRLFENIAQTVMLDDYREGDGYRQVRPEECFEYVVDATGNESGIDLAMHLVRRMGTIILKSTYAKKANIDLSYFAVNEITLIGSRCGPFEPAIKLLYDGKVRFPKTELYELADYEKAFASSAFKAGFRIG